MKIAFIVSEQLELAKTINIALNEAGYVAEIIASEIKLCNPHIQKIPDLIIADFGYSGSDLFDATIDKLSKWITPKIIVITTTKSVEPFERRGIDGKNILVMPFELEAFIEVLGT